LPRTSPAYTEAFRLLKGLSMFVPIFPDEVPQDLDPARVHRRQRF